MKTIKIIDLLNKIAKGEEVPKRVKYDNYMWVLKEQFSDYWYDGEYLFIRGFDMFENAMCFLNDEVEIIEEEKDDFNGIRYYKDGICYMSFLSEPVKTQDITIEKEIEKIDTSQGVSVVHCTMKINELIDVVNELKRGN